PRATHEARNPAKVAGFFMLLVLAVALQTCNLPPCSAGTAATNTTAFGTPRRFPSQPTRCETGTDIVSWQRSGDIAAARDRTSARPHDRMTAQTSHCRQSAKQRKPQST